MGLRVLSLTSDGDVLWHGPKPEKDSDEDYPVTGTRLDPWMMFDPELTDKELQYHDLLERSKVEEGSAAWASLDENMVCAYVVSNLCDLNKVNRELPYQEKCWSMSKWREQRDEAIGIWEKEVEDRLPNDHPLKTCFTDPDHPSKLKRRVELHAKLYENPKRDIDYHKNVDLYFSKMLGRTIETPRGESFDQPEVPETASASPPVRSKSPLASLPDLLSARTTRP